MKRVLLAFWLILTVLAPNDATAQIRPEVRTNWFHETIDIPIREWTRNAGATYMGVDDYLHYIPLVGFATLGFAVPCEHDFLDRALIGTTGYAAIAAMVVGTKIMVHTLRPDGSDYNSFPSGHAARAFLGAELMRREYGPWWGLGAYTVATGTAFMRIWNDRHWTSDVLAGAAVGILGANIGYWLLPFEKRILGLENSSTSIALLPAPGGLSLTCRF